MQSQCKFHLPLLFLLHCQNTIIYSKCECILLLQKQRCTASKKNSSRPINNQRRQQSLRPKKPRHGITQPKQFNELYTQKHYAITLKNMINVFKTLFVLYLNYLFNLKKCNLLFCVRRFPAVILLLLYNKRFYFFKEKTFLLSWFISLK